MYYRAGGMMTINAIFGRELMLDRSPITFTSKMERLEGYGSALAATQPFTAGDVLILHSVSGRNPVIIDMALHAKEKGQDHRINESYLFKNSHQPPYFRLAFV